MTFPLPAVDRLSALPDELLATILWLLPTCVAARTSVLSSRFRDLWKNSPSVELISREMPFPQKENFLAMVDHVLFSRDADAHPLLRLHLEVSELRHEKSFVESFVSSLFVKVCTFGLRHLTVEGRDTIYLLSDIFSVKSLETLSLGFITTRFLSYNEKYVFPSASNLTRLRSLTVELFGLDPSQFHQLISELFSLEDLSVTVSTMNRLSIASSTIRKLNLVLEASTPKLDIVMLSLPFLEVFHLEKGRLPHRCPRHFPRFQGEIPLLRKAVLTIDCVRKKDGSGVTRLMNYVSHVQELNLNVKEYKSEKDPFLILSEPGKEVPNFPNLKHLEVTMCFCEHNLRAAVSMLYCSPALQSVKLFHELAEFTDEGRRRTRKDWKSKLPRNADGNYRSAYSRNLHLGANRLDFLNALSKKCTSKSQA